MPRLIAVTLMGLAIVCLQGSQSVAATIELQFTGLDIVYDGSSITDANAVGADALTTATLTVDGAPSTSSPFTSGLSVELDVPGVTDIAVGGDNVTSSPGGSLTLNFPGGDFVALDLESADIGFVNAGFARFAFGGSVAAVSSQMLPDGLVIGDPISFSFSTTLNSFTDNGVNLLTFDASGTGEVEG
ncbi:MAG: hypothetical protein AAFV43_04990, partial [Planctomycetota bacterium]